MKTLLFCALLLIGERVRAETAYQVDLISPSRAYLFVDKAWQPRAECVEAKVTVSDSTPSEGLIIKAYFFSADGKLLEEVKEPTKQGDGHSGTVKQPATLARGKKYSFFFGIPDKIKAGANKWKRVVVVFGKPGATDAKIYPKDDMAKFSFPEKPLSAAK